MNYKKIYSAANSIEAHMIQGLLERESIETNLSGEGLAIATGGLPADVIQVKIFVNEEKYTEALEIISDYEQILKLPAKDGENWECKECNKINPETFEICWSCQTNRMMDA
jgi:hypothetical protein